MYSTLAGTGCVYSNLQIIYLQYSLYTEKYKKLKLKVEINFFLLYDCSNLVTEF